MVILLFNYTSVIDYPIDIILNSKIKRIIFAYNSLVCFLHTNVTNPFTSKFILPLLHFLYAYENYFLFAFCLSEYIQIEKVVAYRANLIIWHGVRLIGVYNILISYCKMHTEEGDINYCLFEELQFHDTQKRLYRYWYIFQDSLLHKLAFTAKLNLFELSWNIIFSSN